MLCHASRRQTVCTPATELARFLWRSGRAQNGPPGAFFVNYDLPAGSFTWARQPSVWRG